MLHYNPADLRLRRDTEAARQRRHGSDTLLIGLGYLTEYNHPERHRLSSQLNCAHCNAPKLPGEAPTVCCNSGQVVLPLFDRLPVELQRLFNNPQFLKDIRQYNKAFAFTSMGASTRANDPIRQDETVAGGGIYNYRIQGALCHRIGSLTHLPMHAPSFTQLYFYDSIDVEQYNAVLNTRMSFYAGLDRSIMATL
uniref:Helitron helicase-like domain-containing protein n=1 Tax=Anopheles minimus TaxID=112268 RepID=A0A182WAE9_9DIPT